MPSGSKLIMCSFVIENIQQSVTENIRPILNTRYWSTDVYQTVYFNDFVFYGFKSKILSKVIVNGTSGSSLRFRRFITLSLTAVDLDTEIVKWSVMANFIDFEVGVESPTNDPDDEVSEYSNSLGSFIDDGNEDDALLSRSFYHKLENVNVSVDETFEKEYKKSLVDMSKTLNVQVFVKLLKKKEKLTNLKMLKKG